MTATRTATRCLLDESRLSRQRDHLAADLAVPLPAVEG